METRDDQLLDLAAKDEEILNLRAQLAQLQSQCNLPRRRIIAPNVGSIPDTQTVTFQGENTTSHCFYRVQKDHTLNGALKLEGTATNSTIDKTELKLLKE